MTDRMTAARTIVLPWPDKRLNPNARVHWGDLARVKKKARLNAAWEARTQGAHVLKGEEGNRIRAAIYFAPPDKRKRDLDNLIASLKPALDGLSDVIGIDDSQWTFTAHLSAPAPGGQVRLELERFAHMAEV